MGPFQTKLRRIPTPGGDVLHGMKASDPGFSGFGEAYFSMIAPGVVKGWKRHLRMTLNFVVPAGLVRVLVTDGSAMEAFQIGADGADSYARLTIPSGLWVAFGGLAATPSIILNVANLEHDPSESESTTLETFPWSWDG